ncbi:MAG TPA: copper resistance protein NlpE [Niabella sp.]
MIRKQLLPFLLLILIGCADHESGTSGKGAGDSVYAYSPDATIDSTVKTGSDTHKLQGTYTGLLPCASCEGIETSITLYDDQSFFMKEIYKGTQPLDSFTNKGKYEVKDGRLYLKLEGAGVERPVIYTISPNSLTQLDMNGNAINSSMADHYILMKN